MQLDIQNIIKQRLGLQSTERKLRLDFNIPANFDYIVSQRFINVFKGWGKEMQLRFVEVLGGKFNKNKTLDFLLNK